ncbi:MAG TPA: TonB family protein [Vicinamibacteria bacterium]|nr:TonB family protein [Vicinamibacteria bacterium]
MDETPHAGEHMPSVIGRYQVQESIGYGAMGAVYKAFDPLIKRTLAIKTIRLDIPRQSPQYKSFIERFYHEARISGTLSHPNIVTLFDIGEEGGLPYLAMEYVEGETIASILERGLRFKPEKVIGLVSQVASAVDYAHTKGVIHRDIKPSNLILYDTDRVKVTDFGIAKLVDAEMTQSGTLLGTPSYMSPEQAMGDKLDGRSDIFSLGVCAFEMLCGEQPFPGNNVTSILYKLVHVDPIEPANLEMNGLVPEKWHEVFGRVLAKKPDDRYQTATEFVQDLEYCLGAWFGAIEETGTAGTVRAPAAAAAPPARPGDEVTAALPVVTDEAARKTDPPGTRPPVARPAAPPPAAPARKTTPPVAPPPIPAPPRAAPVPAPARRTGPPTANLGTGTTRLPAARAPQPDNSEEATVFLKAPPPVPRRPAASAVPPPEEADAATVLMRGPAPPRATGARPARAAAPEPESEEPATILMKNVGEPPAPPIPPPLPETEPPPPPEEEVIVTETAPAPVIPEPRRSMMTLALGGIGLVLFLIVLTTALIVLWNRKNHPPVPSPAVVVTTPAPVKPSATPVLPTSGVVHVESVPAGATVSVDGQSVGKTPFEVQDVPLGAHEIKVELEGYAPAVESVMLTAQTPRTEVRPTLSRTAPAKGTADVSSTPPGAMVKIDNTAVGLTPLRGHSLNVGRHRFEITAEGFEPFTASATVKENQTARVDAQLKAIPKPTPRAATTPAPPAVPTPDPHVYDENDATLSAKPVKTTGKSAEYPREALQLKRGQRASVTCSFVVLESGDVTDVQVVESAGEAVDNAVVTAYKSWKFTPGMKQGAKVKVRVTRRQTFLGG